jgi:hypothetical protein
MAIRLSVVLVLAAAVGALVVLYRLRREADARRGSVGLPPLPFDLVSSLGPTWVVFTTPLCVTCDQVERILVDAFPDERVVKVDVTVRTELCEAYEVRRAPTVVRGDTAGVVSDRLVGVEAVQEHLARLDRPAV